MNLTKVVTTSDLLVAGITTNGGDVTGVSDSLNGPWSLAKSVTYGNGHVDLYYLAGSKAGNDSITAAGGGSHVLTVAEYSGVPASAALDQVTGGGTGGSTLTAGPTAAIGGTGELVVGTGGQTYVGSGFSAGTGFSLRETAVFNWLAANGLEDAVSGSAMGQSMTMRVGSSVGQGYAGAIVAVFKTASTGPSAALALSPASVPVGTQVTADASGSSPGANPISTYAFNFGDGTTVGPQSGATATHTYTAGGVFTVTLTVTDTGGNSSQATAKETVGKPSASLTVTPSSGSPPLAVSADASGSTDATGVPITSYTFNFGDGTTLGPQSSATVSHTYSVAGSYTASVTVADATGATSTATAPVSVVNGPTAALKLTPTGTPVGQQMTADASASTAGSNPISTYTFNFGDGTTVGPQSSATATHKYTTGGIFTVTVTVTDSVGNSSQATAQETVGQPSAALSVSPSSGSPPLAVSADASGSTDASGVPITNYSFNFGDGTTAVSGTSAKVTHTFTATGSYTVTVTVTDGTGATSTATAAVSVVNGPTAALSLTPTSTSVGKQISASAAMSTAGTSPISTYTFDFGDGTAVVTDTAPADTATHKYTTGGIFTVTVTVTDSAGHSSQATAQETVGQPAAALTVSPSSGTPPLAVTADGSRSTDAIGVPITSYSFNFGDGTTVGPQSSASATHTYSTAGGYTVTLTVTDSAGATSTATQTVTVSNPPVAALTVTPTSGTVPLTVSANASGSVPGSNPISSYTFNFGDGTIDGPQTADTDSHTYLTAGTFTVTVTVTDSAGLTSSATQTVTATSTYVVQDTFRRANQSGWGTASNGMTWSAAPGLTSGGTLSVASDEGLISNSGPHSSFEALGNPTTADGNGLVRFSVNSTGDTAGMLLRLQSNGAGDLARYDGNGHLQFMTDSGGGWSGVSSTSFSPKAGSYYWLRFELQGSNVYLKVWADGTSEPSAWTWSGTSSTVTSAGQMGLYGWAASGAPVAFDSFSVASISSTPPNSTITGTVSPSGSTSGVMGVTVSTIPASTTATTSSSGTYSLPVAAGTYTVVFTAASVGYNNNDLRGVTAPSNGSVTASESLVPIPPQVAIDQFTQPDQTGGWSPSTDGHTWTSDLSSPPNGVPANGAGITANQAWVDTSNSTSADVDTWMGYQYANQEVSANIQVASVVNDPTFQHGPRLLARVQGSSTSWNAILMTIDPPNGSNPTPPGSSQACTAGDISLWVTIPSNWTELAMVCQPVSKGSWYHAKLDVVGSQVEGKIWAFGTVEPAWQVISTQTLLVGTGEAGTRTTGSYVDWGNFQESPITQISGQVTAASNGAPISGATVTLNNGLSTTTDSSGNYSFSGLPGVLPGGTQYTVSASATGYTSGSGSITPSWGGTSTVNLSLT